MSAELEPVQPAVSLDSESLQPLSVTRYEGGAGEWDSFALAARRSTFCHLYGWGEVIQQILGQEPVYLVAATDEGEWRGVLPLVHVRSRIFGRYLVSMPYLSYGGPLGTPHACWTLQEAAANEARRAGVELLELRTRRPISTPLRRVSRKITVLLDLPRSSDELWRKQLGAKRRSDIRRAHRAGLEIRFGLDMLGAFHSVFARNMRDLGSPALPLEFFEAIAAMPKQHVRIGVVHRNGTPAAAGFGFVWQGEFELTWASSVRECRAWCPNEMLYWSFMERLIAEGVYVFNFGRCSPGSGTHAFKRKWGGRDVPLPWIQAASAPGVNAPPTPDRPAYRLASALWRRLPLAVTNRLGSRLVRGIP